MNRQAQVIRALLLAVLSFYGCSSDDPSATDNFCENQQFFEELQQAGYTVDSDLWFRWEEGAPHNEAAWATQVSRPLQIFSSLGD